MALHLSDDHPKMGRWGPRRISSFLGFGQSHGFMRQIAFIGVVVGGDGVISVLVVTLHPLEWLTFCQPSSKFRASKRLCTEAASFSIAWNVCGAMSAWVSFLMIFGGQGSAGVVGGMPVEDF
eukprot:611470-Ditylum_brightwellii.AAC.1